MTTLPTYGLGDRTSLWHTRWPLIAKTECVDQVAAAPKEQKEAVRWSLPCETCELNTECLTGKLKEVGGLMFDREYQTRPRASESSLFPYDRMEPCFKPNLSLVENYRKPLGAEERYAVCEAWDLAWSEHAGGDWLVVFVAMLDRETRRKRILEINRWQRLTFRQQIDLMTQVHRRYNGDLVVIESDAAQVIWKQYLEETTPMPVLAHSAGTKSSFEHGVPGLLRDIDAHRWEIPMAPDGRNSEMVKVWLSECEAFGWQDDKLRGVGEHDDTVMAWWHCDWGLERMRTPSRVRVRSGRSRGAEL